MSEPPVHSSDARSIALPDEEHKLYCWKVKSGSAVRKDETVALAIRRDASAATSSPGLMAKAVAASQHRRPSKRRRTGQSTNLDGDGVPSTAQNSQGEGLSSSDRAVNHDHVPLIAPADGILTIGVPRSNDPLLIGFVEPCTHSTVVEGLCAICGKSVTAHLNAKVPGLPFESQPASPRASVHNMSRITVSGGMTVSVSESEAQRMTQGDSDRLRKLKKLSLVLDLDHTLVHATHDVRAREHLQRDDVRSLLLPNMEPMMMMMGQTQWIQHFVKLRPHVKEFLEKVHQHYEIGVYTAGTREYAEQITLLLARQVIGSPYDQADVLQIQTRLAKVQAHLSKQNDSKQAQVGSMEVAVDSAGGDSNKKRKVDDSFSETMNGASEAIESDDLGPPPAKKLKGVRFGEPPPTVKTDRITHQDVEDLRRQLAEAERLEAKTIGMRQKLFGSRVVSRTDVGDLGADVKSLKRIFPCGGTMAAVVDDREDVWANAQESNMTPRKGEPPENLLLVRPYHWDTIVGYADVNNAAGVDLSVGPGETTGQSELDEQLLWTCDVLLRLHRRFYERESSERTSVPQLLAEMRREVLTGCNIVLSGLVPLHKQAPSTDSSRPRPNVVRYVESLGGTVQPNVTSEVTHVVGAKDGTDKVLAARKVPGCFVVKPSWLMECLWTVTRRDEFQHLLGSVPSVASVSLLPLGTSTKDNSSTSSSDENDDLVAEFENDFMQE